MTTLNEDGTRAADPMTKVGISMAIRDLAARHGVKRGDGFAALEWALARKILMARPGIVLERGRDDLILTPYGEEVVASYWNEIDRRRAARGKRPTLT